MKRLAVIGGGSWGTGLAVVLAPRFEQVRLWVREPELAARARQSRENDVFLPGVAIPAGVEITSDIEQAGDGAEIALMVVPSRYLRGAAKAVAGVLPGGIPVVSATKGIEAGSLLRMSQVLAECLPGARIAVLSGPTFAREVALGQPAAVAIAAEDAELSRWVQEAFSGRTFRLYTNGDVVGVEVGAALKNVVAIAAGVCQGLGLGSNSRAALITRGLAEITRLAVAMGGRAQTLAGLAGLGDLVLTCTGDLSRNRKVGIELASGKPLRDIVASTPMIAEGVETTFAAVELSAKYGVDLPITREMAAILEGRKSAVEALGDLMLRSLKGE